VVFGAAPAIINGAELAGPWCCWWFWCGRCGHFACRYFGWYGWAQARLLGSTSRIGAELDSFSDLLSFGAAPAIVVYFKALNQWGGIFSHGAFLYGVALLIMLLVVLCVGLLYAYPWMCLSLCGVTYLILIPLSWRKFKRQAQLQTTEK
jgi:phosphatidylserine synthase